MLNPIESCYIEHASKRSGRYDGALDALMNALMATHRNFDLGDEQIIPEIAKAEKGRFVVGEMAYRIVVVPQMLTIRASTVALLSSSAPPKAAPCWSPTTIPRSPTAPRTPPTCRP